MSGGPFLFGQDITAEFYPLRYDKYLSNAELTALTLVNIYVFSDTSGKPTIAQAQAGTGAVQGPVSSWTASEEGFTYALAAINDPDQAGGADIRHYWVAVNFKLKSTATQVETVILELELRRAVGFHARIETSEADLQQHYPKVDDIFSPDEQQDLIATAKQEIQDELAAKFVRWMQITQLDRLNRATALLALTNGFLSEIVAPGDRWNILADRYGAKYDAAMAQLQLEYDASGDGQADTKVAPRPSFLFINEVGPRIGVRNQNKPE